jgi:hypothetical protein
MIFLIDDINQFEKHPIKTICCNGLNAVGDERYDSGHMFAEKIGGGNCDFGLK